jgi:hypothetical protein
MKDENYEGVKNILDFSSKSEMKQYKIVLEKETLELFFYL